MNICSCLRLNHQYHFSTFFCLLPLMLMNDSLELLQAQACFDSGNTQTQILLLELSGRPMNFLWSVQSCSWDELNPPSVTWARVRCDVVRWRTQISWKTSNCQHVSVLSWKIHGVYQSELGLSSLLLDSVICVLHREFIMRERKYFFTAHLLYNKIFKLKKIFLKSVRVFCLFWCEFCFG